MDRKQFANKINLKFLLQYLACPADGPSDLMMIRNADHQVVALHSKDREYPVIDDIPNMMPGNAFKLEPAWGKWENLLEKWDKAFGSMTNSTDGYTPTSLFSGLCEGQDLTLLIGYCCARLAHLCSNVPMLDMTISPSGCEYNQP